MSRRLEGKSALITGAARGIGRAFAEAYVREGATVAIGDINMAAAEKAAAGIGDAAYPVKLDVADQASIDAAVAAVEGRAGGLDILVNNAALFDLAPIVEIGRAAKAEIVIYITIDNFALSPDGQTFSPSATFRAKVLDARDEKRLWPEDAAGHAVSLSPTRKTDFVPRNNSEMLKSEVELGKRTGLAIAQLFAKHLEERSAVQGK